MAGLTKNELITWLREKPQTMGWGAILAFNRTDTNTVLLQEYIDRFSTGHFLPPVEGYVGDSDTVGQFITDYVLDYPRLSFQVENTEEKIASALLTMKVVGGTQVTFADVPGGREATRIEVVDPLNGPELTLNVYLANAPATVNSAGKVLLDLSKSSDFSLSYSDFAREQRLGGEFFQTLFEDLDDAERVMVISEITKDSNSSIKPETLKIRTQSAPGAKTRGAENYGDGAVVVYVAMEGEAPGGNPDGSFKYLIPNDSGKSYGATILLGNKFLLETMGRELLGRDYIGFGAWTTKVTASKFWEMNPAGGHLVNSSFTFRFGSDAAYSGSISSPFNWDGAQGGDYMHFTIKNDAVDVSYLRSTAEWCNIVRCWDDQNRTFDAGLSAAITAHVARPYTLNATAQVIEPGQTVVDNVTFKSGVGEGFDHQDFALQGYSSNQQRYDAEKLGELGGSFSRLLTFLPPVNTFVLHSLLFRSKDAVVLDDMAMPGDMAIFGRVGPAQTKFTLDPLQPLIGTSETVPFKTIPGGQSGLTWKVENILGGTGDPGTINTSSGLYTAPASIEGASTRVKVTASGSGHSSSALVSVVVNDITVSPLIQGCDGGHTRTLSAGTKGTGVLTWSLKTPGNGGKLEAGENGKQVYTAPTALGDKAWFVEEIVVKNQLTNKTKSAWIMVALVTLPLAIVKDASVSLPAGQIKLYAKSGTSTIPPAEVTWKLLAGAGNDPVDGLYTQPERLDQRFALLLASWPPSPEHVPDLKLEGYVLLPLPLFDYPQEELPGLHFMTV